MLLRSRDDVIAQMREDERVHMVTVSSAMEAKEEEKAALVHMRNEAQNQLNWYKTLSLSISSFGFKRDYIGSIQK